MSTPSDREHADLLVIGAGPAGLAAAETGASLGATVLLAEVSGDVGGNAAFSTGYLSFADTSVQRAAGIRDSPEEFLADMDAEVTRRRTTDSALVFDRPVAERFARDSGAAFEALRNRGFTFGRLISRPLQHKIDRTIVLNDPTQFRDVFVGRLATLKTSTLLRRRATELVMSGGATRGAVFTGSQAASVLVQARYGVVIATGGYQASAEMRARFNPALAKDLPYPGLDTNRGDGHSMLQAAGAQLVNMHVVPEVVLIASRLVENCIAITEEGERFHDEAGPESDRLTALKSQPGGIGYYLCDARTAREKAHLIADVPAAARTLPDLPAVARLIGAEPATLAGTVERWNLLVTGGSDKDPDFGRVVFPEPRVGIVEPPFTVFPMVVGTNITGGGARVSPAMEVLDPRGIAIPGLFLAGDCNGSMNAVTGIGGVHLAAALTLGHVAARAALT